MTRQSEPPSMEQRAADTLSVSKMIEPYTIAARRDASAYERPNVTRTKKVHVWGEDMMSACGGSFLTETATYRLDGVPGHLRCRRPDCRERWPK